MYALDAAPLGYYTRLLNYNCALLTFTNIMEGSKWVLDNVLKLMLSNVSRDQDLKKPQKSYKGKLTESFFLLAKKIENLIWAAYFNAIHNIALTDPNWYFLQLG